MMYITLNFFPATKSCIFGINVIHGMFQTFHEIIAVSILVWTAKRLGRPSGPNKMVSRLSM